MPDFRLMHGANRWQDAGFLGMTIERFEDGTTSARIGRLTRPSGRRKWPAATFKCPQSTMPARRQATTVIAGRLLGHSQCFK